MVISITMNEPRQQGASICRILDIGNSLIQNAHRTFPEQFQVSGMPADLQSVGEEVERAGCEVVWELESLDLPSLSQALNSQKFSALYQIFRGCELNFIANILPQCLNHLFEIH